MTAETRAIIAIKVIGYCKTCKWWHSDPGGDTCERLSGRNSLMWLCSDDDERDHHIDLETDPDFGCVMWEEREA